MKNLAHFVVFFIVLTGCLHGCQAVDSKKLLVIGDMGGWPSTPYTTAIQRATAKEMGVIADLYSVDLILELGDNFYYDGVLSVDDPRFKETFEDVYTAPSLQVPWYLIAGNHDHHGNVSAQIAYSQVSKRWNFPHYWYQLKVPLPGGATLEVLMVDTVILAGNVLGDFDHSQPRGPSNSGLALEQWAWIEQSLRESKSDYLFVAGHYPIYSVAEHGPTTLLVENLLPLLQKYRANGYLCGHDHNVQHLRTKTDNHTLEFLVSGSANFMDESMDHRNDVPPGSLVFHFADELSNGAFMFLEASPQNITFTVIRSTGQKIHRGIIYPRKAPGRFQP